MDNLGFLAEEDKELETSLPPWKIIIVDDTEEIHEITTLVLRDFKFEGRPLEFLHAYSGAEALHIISNNNDIALALVDVVMETEHAGLDLVRDIREAINNNNIRIVLRTGQPGQAPEEKVIVDYDINDYKAKTELTAIKLKTTVYATLRSYRDLITLENHRHGLERVLQALSNIHEQTNFTAITSSILYQTAQVLALDENAIFLSVLSNYENSQDKKYNIIAAIGTEFEKASTFTEKSLPSHVIRLFDEALEKHKSIVQNEHYICYMKGEDGSQNLLYVSKQSIFTELDIKLLKIFTTNVSIAIKNISLKEEMEFGRQELVHILGEAVESRSKETGSHVKRVGEISSILARAYGLNSYECELILLAAPLHDAGKIAIADNILNKPSKLDTDEFLIMKTHSQLGHVLLSKSKSPVLQHASVIALEHHENWDGSGYPNGIKGKDINVFARITGLVDVYDALGSVRCYKDAWKHQDIINFIQDQSGKKFEPKLVDLFIENIVEIQSIRSLYPDEEL